MARARGTCLRAWGRCDWLQRPVLQCIRYGFGEPTVFRQPDRLLDDGDTITFGDSRLTMLETPGHTAGGGSYYGDGNLFCGDTLFANGGIGRQDVSGGALAPILTSLRKLLALPADTVIYPGHGEMTTVARERLMHGL